MKERNEIEKAFGKLPDAMRATILARWGYSAVADIPDALLNDLAADVAECSTATDGHAGKSTGEALADIAADVYGKKSGGGPSQKPAREKPEDVELSPRPALKSDDDAGEASAEIDPAKIYGQYNAKKANPRGVKPGEA